MIHWEHIRLTESRIIEDIVQRTMEYGYKDNLPLDRMSLSMDIRACHLKTPLRLNDLLTADEFNFKHDVFGIMNHIDRNTGELRDSFSPTFSC